MVTTLAGCGSNPPDVDTRRYEPLVLVPAAVAGVRDRRAEFRELLCNEPEGPDPANVESCESTLRHFRGERSVGDALQIRPELRSHYRLAVVPGMAWDCFRDIIDMAQMPSTRLAEFGFDAQLIEVEGLSSTDRNAEIIAEALLADPSDKRPFILFGYSKGAPDLLVALERYPALREQTAALVTVAGAVGGSPIAEHTTSTTLSAIKSSPFGDCSTSAGDALKSLHPAARHGWMADFLPLDLPSYAMIAAPEPHRVSRALRSSYQVLGSVHPLNDGAVLHWDQLLPGTTLLGYANADHWAVALPLTVEDVPLGDFLVSNGYPRTRLWLAMADFVIADLNRVNPQEGGDIAVDAGDDGELKRGE